MLKDKAWIFLSGDFTVTTAKMKKMCYYLVIYKGNFNTALVFNESNWHCMDAGDNLFLD